MAALKLEMKQIQKPTECLKRLSAILSFAPYKEYLDALPKSNSLSILKNIAENECVKAIRRASKGKGFSFSIHLSNFLDPYELSFLERLGLLAGSSNEEIKIKKVFLPPLLEERIGSSNIDICGADELLYYKNMIAEDYFSKKAYEDLWHIVLRYANNHFVYLTLKNSSIVPSTLLSYLMLSSDAYRSPPPPQILSVQNAKELIRLWSEGISLANPNEKCLSYLKELKNHYLDLFHSVDMEPKESFRLALFFDPKLAAKIHYLKRETLIASETLAFLYHSLPDISRFMSFCKRILSLLENPLLLREEGFRLLKEDFKKIEWAFLHNNDLLSLLEADMNFLDKALYTSRIKTTPFNKARILNDSIKPTKLSLPAWNEKEISMIKRAILEYSSISHPFFHELRYLSAEEENALKPLMIP